MSGNATFKVAVKRMADVIQEALDFNGINIKEVNLLIPHQANKRIISAVGEKLGFQIDVNKVHFFDYETEKAI